MKYLIPSLLLTATLLMPMLLAADQADLDRHIQRQADVVRSVGLVRYFHPHEATEMVDWNSVLLRGFALADAASSDAEFVGALAALLGGLGAGIAHLAAGDEVEQAEVLDCGPDDAPVRWVHRGFGAAPAVRPPPIYVSRRSVSGRPEADSVPASTAMQMLPAEPMRENTLRFSAEVRLLNEGKAALWVRVDGPGSEGRFFDNMEDRLISDREWAEHAIEFAVAADADQVAFGLMARGSAQAEFRNIVLEQLADGHEGTEVLPLAEDAWRLFSPSARHEMDLSADHGELLVRLNPNAGDEAWADIDRFIPADAPEIHTLVLLDGSVLRVPMVLCESAARLNEAERQRIASEFVAVDIEPLSQSELARLDVAVLWPVVRHFYPYQELVDDWSGMLAGALREAIAVDDRDQHRRLIKRLLVPLQDGHVHVFDRHPGARRDIAWLPISLHSINAELVVGNSRHAKLWPGDRVTAIDGEPAAAWIQARFDEFSGSAQWRMERVRRRFLAGPRGEVRVLSLERAGENLDISLTHELDDPVPLHPHEVVARLADGVIYVDLTVIDQEQFAEVLPDLVEASAVVFESRGYPTAAAMPLLSHLLEQPDDKAGWMRTLVARAPDGDLIDAARLEWSLQPQPPRIAAPVFFLTHGSAISYSESVLGMVRYHGLGTIVGSNTAGSNGNVIFLDLPGQMRVMYTGMRVIGPDGEIFQGVGLAPDVRVYPTIEGVRAGRDEVLERALELIE